MYLPHHHEFIIYRTYGEHTQTKSKTRPMLTLSIALYQRSLYVLALLTVVWCGQVIVMGTTMHHPQRMFSVPIDDT